MQLSCGTYNLNIFEGPHASMVFKVFADTATRQDRPIKLESKSVQRLWSYGIRNTDRWWMDGRTDGYTEIISYPLFFFGKVGDKNDCLKTPLTNGSAAFQWMLSCDSCHRWPGARPTNAISIEFEILPKFPVICFKMYSTDHNEILHMSRQCTLSLAVPALLPHLPAGCTHPLAVLQVPDLKHKHTPWIGKYIHKLNVGRNYLSNPQTSTVAPLKLGNGWVIWISNCIMDIINYLSMLGLNSTTLVKGLGPLIHVVQCKTVISPISVWD